MGGERKQLEESGVLANPISTMNYQYSNKHNTYAFSACFVIHKITVGRTIGILSSLSTLKLYASKI